MSRLFLVVALLLAGSYAPAQDPTVPNQALVQRLKLEASTTAPQRLERPAEIQLKAMVMADADHGMALLEAESRRFVIQLNRTALKSDPGIAEQRNACGRIELAQGSFYVEAFSTTSIVLSNGQQQITVRSAAVRGQ